MQLHKASLGSIRGAEAPVSFCLSSALQKRCSSRIRTAEKVSYSNSWQKRQPCRASRRQTVLCLAVKTEALLFDCDGVILLSEDLHRIAYNAAFEHFDVRPKGESWVAVWSEEFYDKLQNKIGGGKPKMRWYFGEYGWPESKVLDHIPESEEDKTKLIDILQEWKTNHYQELVASGEVKPREGVIELFDEARRLGLKVGVCSAATKSSAIAVLENLLGMERFKGLDVFMAGDDVPEKKPDPSIYRIAAERIGVDPKACLVIEDSTIGLQAAQGAGMRCIITYTSSTENQPFDGAEHVLSGLGLPDTPKLEDLVNKGLVEPA